MSTLIEFTIYKATKPFIVEYSLSLLSKNCVAKTVNERTTNLVRWEKHKEQILIQISDPHNQKEKMSLATDLAEVI